MIQLKIVTPQGVVVEQNIDEVRAPGVLGEFGILPGHVPFVSAVKDGIVSWRFRLEQGQLQTGDGFVEVDPQGNVSVIVSSALPLSPK